MNYRKNTPPVQLGGGDRRQDTTAFHNAVLKRAYPNKGVDVKVTLPNGSVNLVV